MEADEKELLKRKK